MPRDTKPCKVDSVLGMLTMVANTPPRNEGILQLLCDGPIIYGTPTGVILSPFSILAGFDRISPNVAILVWAPCQPCTGASNMSRCRLLSSRTTHRMPVSGEDINYNCLRVVLFISHLVVQFTFERSINSQDRLQIRKQPSAKTLFRP